MLRVLPLLLAAAAAVPRAGCTPPRARLTVTPFDVSRPPQAWLRCRTVGLAPPVKFAWKLGPSVRQIGYNIPRDEGALLVQTPDAPAGGSTHVECTATDSAGLTASASTTLAPINITQVTTPPGGTIAVEGAGFGPVRDPDDALYLVPPRGAPLHADHACKQSSWSDARIVACLPPGASGPWQVRVQSGGRLAPYAPPVTVP